MEAAEPLVREYLLLGLRFDRVESGYVDAFTGDPALRRAVEDEPAPEPAGPGAPGPAAARPRCPAAGLDRARADFIAAHLRALACAGRKFAGEPVGFVDEVPPTSMSTSPKATRTTTAQAHAPTGRVRWAAAARWPSGCGPPRAPTRSRRERLSECIDAFSSALRDRVRADYPLPDTETVEYEVVTDKPWSGFNYYLGDYRSTVASQRRPQAADVQPAATGGARVLSGPPHRALPQRGRAGRPRGPGRADASSWSTPRSA